MARFRSRRDFLFESCGGISGLGLASLLSADGLLASDCAPAPALAKKGHFAPRARSVVSLFMSGGVSHVDTFDPKPALAKYAGQPLTGKGEVVVRQGHPGPLMPSPFKFSRHGQSGLDVSEIFPQIASHADELAVLRSVFSKSNDHVQAHYALASGMIRMGFPSLGSWVTYGLGSESNSLPAFVVIYDARGGPFGGPSNWSAGFMPAAYQGTVFRPSGTPIVDLKPPERISSEEQRSRLDLLEKLNRMDLERNPGNSELAARIESYELAYRMQGCAPEVVDVSGETEPTRKLYGLDDNVTEPFGRQCLMARRLVERGVRFVQLYHGGLGNQNTDTWDAHEDIVSNHTKHAAEVDRPISGLLTDLRARGLLDSTLVIWQGEFGRMPISQRGVGRDHNPGAMSIWMAGAGIAGGQVVGSSDEFGYKAEEQPVSIHDLHATVLHLLGLDHTRLTFRFNGRDMRLTDVYGTPVPQIAKT
ncbi:MAG TPA: DUF1501 domain-containing protein [Bryobacteraceae bacterium]|nr:DUF1501 domain-containing protein [Bryobacteraceae bacterium]